MADDVFRIEFTSSGDSGSGDGGSNNYSAPAGASGGGSSGRRAYNATDAMDREQAKLEKEQAKRLSDLESQHKERISGTANWAHRAISQATSFLGSAGVPGAQTVGSLAHTAIGGASKAALYGMGAGGAGLLGGAAAGAAGSAVGGAAGMIGGAAGGAMLGAVGGPVGMIVGAAVSVLGQGIKMALDAVRTAIHEFAETAAKYAPGTATAAARGQANAIMGDIRRSKYLDKELSDYTTASNTLEQSSKDLMAELVKPLIPIATAVLNKIAMFIDWFKVTMAFANKMLEQIAKYTPDASTMIDLAFGPAGSVIGQLMKIEQNTRKKDEDKRDMIDKILDMQPLTFEQPNQIDQAVQHGGAAFVGAPLFQMP